MPTTSNFGWTTPADTDLVKDGALAIRTLGNGIDTSMAELKGGTTGQVLSKTSNTDMDFTWVTQDDANAIQNAIVDAKGDLIAATANDTPARLAVGSNGDTLVADSAASTGLRWQGNYAAGKNKILNSDFSIWQRGTSFSGFSTYAADRWFFTYDNNPTTKAVSRQTFTPGTAPVAGYEGQYFIRMAITTAGTATSQFLYQKIEDVRTLAGQTVTYSFWAKADTTRTVGVYSYQNFGSGGSADVSGATTNFSVTTAWQRFSMTVTLGSMSGKTIGTNSFVGFVMTMPAVDGAAIDFWGCQLEAGSVATAFQTATGTLAGELIAAQRYYYNSLGQNQLVGINTNATTTILTARPPVTMRTTPTATLPSSGSIDSFQDGAKTSASAPTSVYLSDSLAVFASGGYTGLTVGSTATWRSTTAFQLSAEL